MKARDHHNFSIQTGSRFFDLLPAEIADQIISYLPVAAGRQMSSVNSFYRQKMLGDGMNGGCYFTVGRPLHLYSDSYFHLLGLSGEESDFLGKKTMRMVFSTDEVWDSLPNEPYAVTLFSDLEAASLYQYYHSPEYYCRQYDILITTEAPAIFVISLKNDYLVRHRTVKLSEYWYDHIPNAPQKNPQQMVCMQTPESNIRHRHWARLSLASNRQVFWSGRNMTSQSDCPTYFEDIWSAAFNRGTANKESQCLQAMAAIFENYATAFFANFTRHHHNEVKQILTYLRNENKPTLVVLQEQLALWHTKAKNDPAVSQGGLYFKMLDFVLHKINDFKEVNQLQGFDHYFVRKM